MNHAGAETVPTADADGGPKTCRSAFGMAVVVVVSGSAFGQAKVAQSLIVPYVYEHMDVRAKALGNVGVAVPDLGWALDANPALLLHTRKINASLGAGCWNPGYYPRFGYRYAHATGRTYNLPIPVAVGLSFKRMKAENWTCIYYNYSLSTETTFEDRIHAYSLGLAASPVRHLQLGYSLKRIEDRYTRTIPNSDPWSSEINIWAHDLGLYLDGLLPQSTCSFGLPDSARLLYPERWSMPRRTGLGIGFALRNLSNRDIPALDDASLGLSYRFIAPDYVGVLVVWEWQRVLVYNRTFKDKFDRVADMFLDVLTFSSDPRDVTRWGIELNLWHLVDLRLGREVDHGYDPRNRWTYGLGIGTDRVQLNYAHTSTEDLLADKIDTWQLSVRW